MAETEQFAIAMLKKPLCQDSQPGALPKSARPQENWRFTYLGQSHQEALPASCSPGDAAVPASSAFPLSSAQVGDRCQISTFKGPRAAVRQLQKLGVCRGADILIVSRQDSGSVVVRIGSAQIGLSAQMAAWVMVNGAA